MVISGRTTQFKVVLVPDGACVDDTRVDADVGTSVLEPSGAAHAARNAALPSPNNLSASLRERSCPMGLSSLSIIISFLIRTNLVSSGYAGDFRMR